jgi:hypothetical protein
MRKALNFIFDLLILISFLQPVHSQQTRIRGLRLGYDISRLALYYFEPERKEMNFSADFEIKTHIYSAFEYGMQDVKMNNDLYSYQSEGSYFTIGFDKNYLKNIELNQYEMLYGGIRYGYARYSHSASDITIVSDYWGNYTGATVPETKASAHWLELVGGIKGELFKNFFVGWSFRARYLLYQSKDNPLDPYHVPGFGSLKNRTSLGFTYSIYYRIPMYKATIRE